MDGSNNKTAPGDVARDHAIVQNLLNSAEWEERLRRARVEREKVLAARGRQAGAGAAQPPIVAAAAQPPIVAAPRTQTPVPAQHMDRRTASASLPGAGLAVEPPNRSFRAALGMGSAAGLALSLLAQPVTEFARGVQVGVPSPQQVQASASSRSQSGIPGAKGDTVEPLAGAGPRASAQPEGFSRSTLAGGTVSLIASSAHAAPPVTGLRAMLKALPEPASDLTEPAISVSSLVGPVGRNIPVPAIAAPGRGDAAPVTQTRPAPVAAFEVEAVAAPTAPTEAAVQATLKVAPDTRHAALAAAPRPPGMPGGSDGVPETADVPAIPGVGRYLVNLHLAGGGSAEAVQKRLAGLGLVRSTMVSTSLAPGRTMVAYFRAEDAQTARTLARHFEAEAIDMAGLTPAPPDRTLDLFVSE